MSIQIDFTPHNTIRVECDGEVVEVALQPPPASAAPDRGRGPAVGMRPVPGGPWPGRPPQDPGVMAIIANKKIKNDELDWLQFNPELKLESLDTIDKMDNGQLREFIARHASGLDLNNTLLVIDVGVTPWSGTTPAQLQNLRRIVEDDTFGLDGVRIFRMPDEQQ